MQRHFLEEVDAEDLQDPVHVQLEAKTFSEDGHQDEDGDGGPDLDEHGIGCGSVEGLDTQVLLDPLEE